MNISAADMASLPENISIIHLDAPILPVKPDVSNMTILRTANGSIENQFFLNTRIAQAVSGIFVWTALLITCHQVSLSHPFQTGIFWNSQAWGGLKHCTIKHGWVMELQSWAQAPLWFHCDRLNLHCHRTKTSSYIHKKDYYLPPEAAVTRRSIHCSHKVYLRQLSFLLPAVYPQTEHLLFNLVRLYIQMHQSLSADEKRNACVSCCQGSGRRNGCSHPTSTWEPSALSDSSGTGVFPTLHI